MYWRYIDRDNGKENGNYYIIIWAMLGTYYGVKGHSS